MRRHLVLIPLAAFAPGGCAVRQQPADSSNPVDEYRPAPQELIADLPRRIALLPVTSSMPPSELLAALGLSEFAGNTSGGIRFNSGFLQLDGRHCLQIRYDPESFMSREMIDAIIDGTKSSAAALKKGRHGVRVEGCTLRRNWDEILAHRDLARKAGGNGADGSSK